MIMFICSSYQLLNHTAGNKFILCHGHRHLGLSSHTLSLQYTTSGPELMIDGVNLLAELFPVPACIVLGHSHLFSPFLIKRSVALMVLDVFSLTPCHLNWRHFPGCICRQDVSIGTHHRQGHVPCEKHQMWVCGKVFLDCWVS